MGETMAWVHQGWYDKGLSQYLSRVLLFDKDPNLKGKQKEYQAMWDTGANAFMIAPSVAKEFKAEVIGQDPIVVLGGVSLTMDMVQLFLVIPPFDTWFCLNFNVDPGLEQRPYKIIIGSSLIEQGDMIIASRADGNRGFNYFYPRGKIILPR